MKGSDYDIAIAKSKEAERLLREIADLLAQYPETRMLSKYANYEAANHAFYIQYELKRFEKKYREC